MYLPDVHSASAFNSVWRNKQWQGYIRLQIEIPLGAARLRGPFESMSTCLSY